MVRVEKRGEGRIGKGEIKKGKLRHRVGGDPCSLEERGKEGT